MKETDEEYRKEALPKKRFKNFLLASLLFIACPGDDIAVIMANLNKLAPIEAAPNTPDPNSILELYWVNKRLEESNEDTPHKHA